MGEVDLAAATADWSPPPVSTTGSTPAWSVAAFSGLLDLPPVAGRGDPLPPLWHWFGFLDHPRQDELGDDGHPAAGTFLPPVPHRRRMIAGGRLEVRRPMRVGEELARRSALTRREVKHGRSGAMLLVTVRHEYTGADGTPAVAEEQDVVYRSQPPGAARGIAAPGDEAQRSSTPSGDEAQRSSTPSGDEAQRSSTPSSGDEAQRSSTPSGEKPGTAPAASPDAVELRTDPTLLFRFSALTYNTHRIHYDEPYVTGVEGYPGLVVHGPLLALMLLEIPRRHRPGQGVAHCAYRLVRPVFSGATVRADHEDTPGGDVLRLTGGVPGAPPSITATITLDTQEQHR